MSKRAAKKRKVDLDTERGTGRTYRAMKATPRGAVYVYYGAREYYSQMAIALGRTDLTFVNVSFFPDWVQNNRGRMWSGLYFDHACQECLSAAEFDMVIRHFHRLLPYIRDKV